MRIPLGLVGMLLMASACSQKPAPTVANSVSPADPVTFAAQPVDVDAETARLRAALVREVPSLIVDAPDGARQWIARTQAALSTAGHIVARPQLERFPIRLRNRHC